MRGAGQRACGPSGRFGFVTLLLDSNYLSSSFISKLLFCLQCEQHPEYCCECSAQCLCIYLQTKYNSIHLTLPLVTTASRPPLCYVCYEKCLAADRSNTCPAVFVRTLVVDLHVVKGTGQVRSCDARMHTLAKGMYRTQECTAS